MSLTEEKIKASNRLIYQEIREIRIPVFRGRPISETNQDSSIKDVTRVLGYFEGTADVFNIYLEGKSSDSGITVDLGTLSSEGTFTSLLNAPMSLDNYSAGEVISVVMDNNVNGVLAVKTHLPASSGSAVQVEYFAEIIGEAGLE